MSDRQWFFSAVLVYGLCTVGSLLLWRRGFRRDNHLLYAGLALGALVHTIAMFQRGFSFQRCPINNLFEATMFLSWTVVVAYLALGGFSRLRFLGAFASPLLFGVGVFALMPELDRRGPVPEFSHGIESAHAALILLAYGAFGLCAVAGIMYLAQSNALKHHKVAAFAAFVPPIQRLEGLIHGLMITGFLLLSLGLLAGGWWLQQKQGYFFSRDPKILWSLGMWLVYLGLLVSHNRYSQGGRRFAWGAAISFAFLLLTFWSTNLISSIHQP